ncbi:MAG: dTMP kinase [Planctomycetota bacterium]|nr:dTMP kinase [Planctomycetota bacterium]
MSESKPPAKAKRTRAATDESTQGDSAAASHAWIDHLRGKFLAFEGPDGCGKSTQYRRFADLCIASGLGVCEVREPGGTPIGERVRSLLLDKAHSEMGVRCEMMLYMASRAQLVDERIRPALAQGKLVLADRFVASTLVYQGAAGGLDPQEILAVAKAATGGLQPDLNVVFDVDDTIAATRAGIVAPAGRPDVADAQSSLFADRMEDRGREFRRRVRAGYVSLCEQDPARYLRIDASGTPEQVWTLLLGGLKPRVDAWAE